MLNEPESLAEQAPVIGATGDAPAVGMTPGQQGLAKQVQFNPAAPVGSSRNPRFQRPDNAAGDLRALPADAVTIDLSGKPRVGPYEDGDLTDDFKKRSQEQEDAEDDRLEAEVMQAAEAEKAAKAPADQPTIAEYYK
ncbi:MAG: hypothetical protein EON59_01750, partial [Alphaproteobacteria bacterium]